MTSPPLDYTKLREIAVICMRWRCECEHGDWPVDKAEDLVSYIDKPHHGDCTDVPMTCLRCEAEAAYRQAEQIAALAPLADNARMVKALEPFARFAELSTCRRNRHVIGVNGDRGKADVYEHDFEEARQALSGANHAD